MHKALSILISFLLFLFVVACGAQGEPVSQPTETAAEPSAEQGEADSGQGVADFFKGKTIEFIVPFSPGGGYDTIARSLAPYLEKYTGATVLGKNVPGGGGNIGNNELYTAEPDGLTLGLLNGGGLIISYLLGVEGVNYDPIKFSYIGRVNMEPRFLFVAGDNEEINNLEDLINYPGTLRFGATGPSSDEFYMVFALSKAFGFSAELITGYEGLTQVEHATMNGEVVGSVGSLTSRLALIKSGDLKPIVFLGLDSPDFPEIPLASKVAQTEEAKQILGSVDKIIQASRPVAGREAVLVVRDGAQRGEDQEWCEEPGDHGVSLC